MSDESEYAKYVKDSRVACKYGAKCYQKNPTHLQKYKHPPIEKNKEHTGHVNKKIRIEEADKTTKGIVTSTNISDSDDYNIEEDSDTSTNGCQNISNEISDLDSKKDNRTCIETDLSNEQATSSTNPVKVHISNDVSDDSDDDKQSQNKNGAKEDVKENNGFNEKQDSSNKVMLNYKKFIKEKFLVDMPNDFYQFWDYCKKMNQKNPLEALKDIGLKLVGPFDVIAGKFDNFNKSSEEYLLHWRYYHDPPEFQTILRGDDRTGYHIGYFRDSPDELPVFLASNNAKKDGVLHQMGDNIFTAINMYLDDLKKTGDPFKKMHIGRIQTSIKKEAENLKLNLSQKTDRMISREKKIVTRTFNKIGLIVPYDRKTQLGYRGLALNNKDLSALFTKLQNALPEQRQKFLAELQPVFTFASIATDEYDFGTGIELGWNIISHGVDSLNFTASRHLATNYRLLKREAFAKIAEVHMNNRKKGCDLSII